MKKCELIKKMRIKKNVNITENITKFSHNVNAILLLVCILCVCFFLLFSFLFHFKRTLI